MNENAFKKPRQGMTGIVSEAVADFQVKATPQVLAAIERSAASSGVVAVSHDFENTATAEQREDRRRKSLRDEGKVDEVLKTDLGGVIRAKYKIEVTFVKTRSLTGLNAVGIQIWESGKRFHGGGDEIMFWCQDNREGHSDGCWAPIPGDAIRSGVAYCANCGRVVNADLLTNMKIGNVYLDVLAKELEKIFRTLGSNADFLIKYHKQDVRYIAVERAKGPEVAKRLKGMHIYPLKNILKDTAHGSDLVKRIKAFITS